MHAVINTVTSVTGADIAEDIIMHMHNNIISGADPGILKRGGSLKKMLLKKRSTVFLKPNQCNFTDHGLIDDSMTYIVARDSRNLALQLQKSTTRDRLLFCMLQ